MHKIILSLTYQKVNPSLGQQLFGENLGILKSGMELILFGVDIQ